MLNRNLSLDCTEIASHLLTVRQLTIGVRKSKNIAQMQTSKCQQGIFKITTVVSFVWDSLQASAEQARNAKNRELCEKGEIILKNFLLKRFPAL